MNDETTWLEFEEILHETEKEYLIVFDGEQIWVPKSVIHDWNKPVNELEISEWFCERNGLNTWAA